jgi:hypothetical protein
MLCVLKGSVVCQQNSSTAASLQCFTSVMNAVILANPTVLTASVQPSVYMLVYLVTAADWHPKLRWCNQHEHLWRCAAVRHTSNAQAHARRDHSYMRSTAV